MDIRVKYIDFWRGFNYKNEPLLYTKLNRKHNIKVVDKNPDILIASAYSSNYKNENAKIKVFYTAERYDFNENEFDFSISFKPQSKTNFYLPNYIRKYGFNHYYSLNKFIKPKKKEKFCCYVATNNVKKRNNFFKRLNAVKQVDSGGKCLNNLGYRAPRGEKYFQFINSYKFMITFENYSQKGYNTEKIYNALYSNTVPIYWGDPTIKNHFNEKSFINYNDFKNEKELIGFILEVDNDDNLYQSFFQEEKLINPVNENEFDLFLDKIIDKL